MDINFRLFVETKPVQGASTRCSIVQYNCETGSTVSVSRIFDLIYLSLIGIIWLCDRGSGAERVRLLTAYIHVRNTG
jgi:hypothetical protein